MLSPNAAGIGMWRATGRGPSGRKIRWRPALLGPGLGEFRSALAASPASELTGSSNLFRGGLGLARLLHRIAGLRLLGATDDDDY